MPDRSDTYQTIAEEAKTELKVQRSLFIAHALEVDSEDKAKEFIARIQAEHRQASHNCFAYRLTVGDGEVMYYSDAGEPSGTAGRPILGAITSLNLNNVVVVVTRYFGGKKLGIRGLIEAYGQAARQVLEAAGIITKVLTREMQLRCGYAELDRLVHILNNSGGKILTSDYGTEISLKVAVPRSCWEKMRAELAKYVVAGD